MLFVITDTRHSNFGTIDVTLGLKFSNSVTTVGVIVASDREGVKRLLLANCDNKYYYDVGVPHLSRKLSFAAVSRHNSDDINADLRQFAS